MPVYDYVCTDCHKEFEKVLTLTEHEGQIVCPHCGSKNVEQEAKAFFADARVSDAARHVIGRQAGVAEDDADHEDIDAREDVDRRAEGRPDAEDHDQQRHNDEVYRRRSASLTIPIMV